MSRMADFLKLFRRRGPIATPDELAEFIDRNAAFLIQKGIYEYARARAGHYSKVLFSEKGFLDAVEQSRWRAYPLGLVMVAEIAEGLLHPAGEQPAPTVLQDLVLSVFDRYPVPAALGESAWAELRAELARRLQQIGLHQPKRAMDVPEQFARSYFNLMPIHEKLRAAEFPTTRNYLRVTICNIHDELSKRLNAPVLLEALARQGA